MNSGGPLLANRVYVSLLISVLFAHLAVYLITPIFPIFLEKVKDFSVSQVGLILGAGSFAFQAGSLLGGFLSDRWGQRTLIVTGTVLQGAAMTGYGWSISYAAFLGFSVLNGIGLGLFGPSVKAMIVNAAGRERRTTAFSWRGIAANIGIIIAGGLITLLALEANRRVFFYAAAVLFLLALLTRLLLPSSRCQQDSCKKAPALDYKHILTHRSFLLFSLVSLLIWALHAQFALVLPLRGEYVLGTTSRIGLIWTINSMVLVLLQGPVSRLLLERVNPYYSLLAGTFLIGLGLFLLGWADRFLTLSLAAIIFILGEMLMLPVWDSLVGYFATEELVGAYYGISNVVSGVGAALGASVGGSLVDRFGGVASSLPWFGYGMATILFVSLLGLFVLYAKDRHGRGRPQPMIPAKIAQK
ncbi:MAG: MFS transporter [Brevibacillus sp.]|nr:MFS transporter [Brevibacillus sp.]